MKLNEHELKKLASMASIILRRRVRNEIRHIDYPDDGIITIQVQLPVAVIQAFANPAAPTDDADKDDGCPPGTLPRGGFF